MPHSRVVFGEYLVENFHPFSLENTKETDRTGWITEKAKEVDACQHELHICATLKFEFTAGKQLKIWNLRLLSFFRLSGHNFKKGLLNCSGLLNTSGIDSSRCILPNLSFKVHTSQSDCCKQSSVPWIYISKKSFKPINIKYIIIQKYI